MKNSWITSALFFFFLGSATAQTNTWLLDSVVCYSYTNGTLATRNTKEYNVSYDSKGRLLTRENFRFNGIVWNPDQRTANLWGSDDNLASQTFFIWNNMSRAWYYDSRFSFQYNSNGVLKQLLKETYNETQSNWENLSRDVYEYSTFEGPDSYLIQLWNSRTNSWRNKELVTNTYLPDGKTNTSIYQKWDTTGGVWLNLQRSTYTYFGDGKTKEIVRENWSNGNWVNVVKSTFDYYPNGLVRESLGLSWDQNSGWVNYTQALYEYDSEGRQTLFFFGIWNGQNYANYFRTRQTYDQNGNLDQTFEDNWKSGRWVLENSCSYFYRQFVSGVSQSFGDFACDFPNPLPKGFSINCPQLLSFGITDIQLFDSTGKLVQTNRLTEGSEFLINESSAPGLYLLVFSKSGQVLGTKKIIIGF